MYNKYQNYLEIKVIHGHISPKRHKSEHKWKHGKEKLIKKYRYQYVIFKGNQRRQSSETLTTLNTEPQQRKRRNSQQENKTLGNANTV